MTASSFAGSALRADQPLTSVGFEAAKMAEAVAGIMVGIYDRAEDRRTVPNLLEQHMKTVAGIIFLALTFMVPSVQSQDSQSTTDAETAARHWLALTDAGRFDQSWDEAAELFQANVTRPAWATAAANARSPLGGLLSRKLRSARYARTLPGAPDGEYVVIQFDTKFEYKSDAIEFVTPARAKDGSWKVSGYFIK